jgi:urease accessory protein UreF
MATDYVRRDQRLKQQERAAEAYMRAGERRNTAALFADAYHRRLSAARRHEDNLYWDEELERKRRRDERRLESLKREREQMLLNQLEQQRTDELLDQLRKEKERERLPSARGWSRADSYLDSNYRTRPESRYEEQIYGGRARRNSGYV